MPAVVRRCRKIAAASLLLMLSAVAGGAQAIPADSAILTILRARVDSGRTPGIVVGVLERGKARFVAHGSAGSARPMNEHTILEIGSISKTFTGLLLADAVTRGDVQLDQPVGELLGDASIVPVRDGRPITLELLATHRSGLPRLPTNLAPANVEDPYADYDAPRLRAFLASHVLARAPGDSAEYSNLGAGLLGHALTVQARAPSWGALVAERITGPLGMRETFVDVPEAMRSRIATGHNEMLLPRAAWNFTALAGAGALRSTASDMLRYLGAALDTTQGPLAAAFALATQPRATFGPGTRIALGWLVVGPPQQPLWWHNGGTAGFRSFAAFDPARQVAVIVLANSSVSVDDIGMHLMNPAMPVVMPMVPPRTRAVLTAEQLDRLVGEYAVSPAMRLVITRDGTALFGQATGQGRFALTAAAPDRFVFPQAGIDITFDISEPGPARRLTLRQAGATIPAARVP